ncbi:MAG: flippase-like domain-containing protein [Caldimicrobium sp.]
MLPEMLRNLLIGFLLLLLILGISFTYLAIKYFPKDLWVVLKSLNKKYLLYTLVSLIFFHTFDTLRVIVLARALKIRYSLWYGYFVSFINTFGATVTPAHLGGEVLPLYTLTRKGGQFYQVLTVITMKGFSGFFFYLLFFPLTLQSLISDPRQAKEFIGIVGSLLILSVLTFLFYKFLIKKEGIFKKELVNKVKMILFRYIITCKIFFKTRKGEFFLALLLSLGMYFTYLLEGVFLVKAFNPSAREIEVFLDQLPLLYAIFISPTPGGSGVGELGALPIFSAYVSQENLGLFVILWRILSQYFSAFIGGVLFFIFLFEDLRKYAS